MDPVPDDPDVARALQIQHEDAQAEQASRRCHGDPANKVPPCQERPTLHTRRIEDGKVMDFCRRCFWLWIAACLELRGEPELEVMAQGIRRHVRAGNFDAPPRPPPQAIPLHYLLPDLGFGAEEE